MTDKKSHHVYTTEEHHHPSTHPADSAPPPPYSDHHHQPSSQSNESSRAASPVSTQYTQENNVSTPPPGFNLIPLKKTLYISQKGNTYRPWPFGNNHALSTPILDSTRTKTIFTSTRPKKNSGTCILTDPAHPDIEIHTKYRFGPGYDPVVAVPGGGPGLTDTPMEISVRAKGKFTRARYFEMPAGFGGPGDLGGRYEWRYVTPSQNAFGHGRGYEEVRKTGCRDGECRPSPNADTDTGCKGKSKSKSESKNPFHSSTNHGAASKMVLERVSLPGLATLASATPLADSKPKLSSGPDSFAASSSSSSPLKIAEFIRCDEHGEEITSGWWGPAGQGGWLRIFEQDDALGEWMIVSTCLVMLKRERDRRTMQMSAAAGQGGGG